MKNKESKEALRLEELSTHSSFLRHIVRVFPSIQTFEDAKESIGIKVTAKDIRDAEAGNPARCALALGAQRHLEGITGAAINRYRSVLVYDTKAVLYTTPVTTHSNLFAFDRGGTVEPGVYMLSKVCPSKRLMEMQRRVASQKAFTGRPRAEKGGKRPPAPILSERKRSHKKGLRTVTSEPLSLYLRTWGNAQVQSTTAKPTIIEE